MTHLMLNQTEKPCLMEESGGKLNINRAHDTENDLSFSVNWSWIKNDFFFSRRLLDFLMTHLFSK